MGLPVKDWVRFCYSQDAEESILTVNCYGSAGYVVSSLLGDRCKPHKEFGDGVVTTRVAAGSSPALGHKILKK